MSSLTHKQQLFVDAYLETFNATEAARRAGYKGNENTLSTVGYENIRKPNIREQIEQRLDESAMSANEVLRRLADMARGDMGDFIDIEGMFFNINLGKAHDMGLTHLIKKVKDRVVMTSNQDGEETETHTLEIELHDSQSALDKLARVHGAYNDRMDLTSDGKAIKVTLTGDD